MKITISLSKVRKKSNKFRQKDFNTVMPKTLALDAKKKLDLMRLKRMSARKQNMGLQDDYTGLEEI